MADYSKGRSEDELEAFYPNEVLRHTTLTFLFISTVMLGVLFLPESYQKSIDEFAAYHARAPWFLLPFTHLAGLIDNRAWYEAILAFYAILFISIPFLDRNQERRLWKKPAFLAIVIINLIMLFTLGLIKFI